MLPFCFDPIRMERNTRAQSRKQLKLRSWGFKWSLPEGFVSPPSEVKSWEVADNVNVKAAEGPIEKNESHYDDLESRKIALHLIVASGKLQDRIARVVVQNDEDGDKVDVEEVSGTKQPQGNHVVEHELPVLGVRVLLDEKKPESVLDEIAQEVVEKQVDILHFWDFRSARSQLKARFPEAPEQMAVVSESVVPENDAAQVVKGVEHEVGCSEGHQLSLWTGVTQQNFLTEIPKSQKQKYFLCDL